MALSISRYCKIISKTFRPSSSSSVRKVWAREASKSCTGTETPAPTPCPPQPRPPCRPPPPSAARTAVRVACCPPPRGRRPPCPAPPRPDPLTCANQRQSVHVSRPGVVCDGGDGGGGCGASQDRVARRLAAAAAARRADYELETRCAAPGGSHPAACAPFSLGAERHCARATDGQVYTLPCAPDPLPPCGPCREPPPPRCVPIQPDDACRVNPRRHVDPCAHRPRTFVEIARGKHEVPPGSAPAPDRSLASRIIDGLTAGTGRKCTPPTQRGGCRRGLHTSVAVMARAEAAPDASSKGIDEVLRERATFKEAGRGRVAGCEAGETRERPPAPSGAQLDLAVPPHAARVSVCVTLHEGPPSCAAPRTPPPSSALRAAVPKAPASCPSNAERRDSWLSFKSIQQKFSNKRPEHGSRDGDESCGKPKPSCPAKPPCPPPCPPPATPPPPPPPKHPYPRHPCPPRPACPPPKTTKLSKDKSGGCNNTTKYLALTVV